MKVVVEVGEDVARDEAIDESPDASDDGARDRRAVASVDGREEGDHGVAVGSSREECDEGEEDKSECPRCATGEAEGFGIQLVHVVQWGKYVESSTGEVLGFRSWKHPF